MKSMTVWFVSDAAAVAAVSLQPIYIMLAARGFGADSHAAGCIASISVLIKLVFGIAGGVVVDIGDRRCLMVASGVIQAAIWSLFYATIYFGFATVSIYSLYVFGSAIVWGLLGGAADAALRGIVKDEAAYVKVKTACEGRNSAIGLICSPVGAILYCIASDAVPIVQSVLFLLSSVFAFALPKNKNKRYLSTHLIARLKGNVRLLGDGFSWVVRRRSIMALLVAASLVNFSYQVWQYGLQYLQLDSGQTALGVGILDMSSCAGIIFGAIVALRLRVGMRPVTTIYAVLISLAAASACLLMRMTGSVSAMLALGVFSVPMPGTSASIQGEIFVEVPDAMQGRARSVLNVVAQGFAFVAPIAASYLSSHGAELAICIASGIAVALALVCAKASAKIDAGTV